MIKRSLMALRVTWLIPAFAVAIVSTGAAAATIGPAKILHFINTGHSAVAVNRVPDSTKHPVSSSPATPSMTPSPSTKPDPSISPYSGSVTIGGHTYGGPLVTNEPTVTIPSSEPLVLSATNVTMAVYAPSQIIYATSPDGYEICSISAEPGALSAGMTNGTCGNPLAFELLGDSRIGTFTTHVMVSTKDKVYDGRYITYDGYITATITGPPSYWLSAGPQQLHYSGSAVTSITETMTVERDTGYNGTPIITHTVSGNYCSSEYVQQTDPDTYVWTCITADPSGGWIFSLNWFGNDGGPEKYGNIEIVE